MISLITATFNRSLQLKRGLSTVLSQDFLPDEIIVVDDGSQDETKQVIADLKSIQTKSPVEWKYIYLNHPEPRISCHAHNVGIQKAAGDILIFTEPENLHIGNTIQQLTDKMKENPEHVVVCTQLWTMGKRIYEKLRDDQFQNPMALLNHPYAQLTDNSNMSNTKAPDSDFAITGSNNCFTGALFAAKRQWLLDVGGYDETFTGHGFDDFDLLHRLELYGKGLKMCNDIIAIHQWHEKNYPYNIYDHAERNGKISEERIRRGEYRANMNEYWGLTNA